MARVFIYGVTSLAILLGFKQTTVSVFSLFHFISTQAHSIYPKKGGIYLELWWCVDRWSFTWMYMTRMVLLTAIPPWWREQRRCLVWSYFLLTQYPSTLACFWCFMRKRRRGREVWIVQSTFHVPPFSFSHYHIWDKGFILSPLRTDIICIENLYF